MRSHSHDPRPPESGGDREPVERITHLLGQAGHDAPAADRLFAIVYDELHGRAQQLMADQSAAHTLQASALVHEAYLKLVGGEGEWQSRHHFFAVAVRAMRSVLVDHARGKGRRKRSAGGSRVSLDDVAALFEAGSVDLVDLDAALSRLDHLDADAARVVELRFFGGLSMAEVAEVAGLPLRTTERTWEFARTWLRKTLS